jgi:hypothetical protein
MTKMLQVLDRAADAFARGVGAALGICAMLWAFDLLEPVALMLVAMAEFLANH